ncbi:MAG: hypothetical protein OEY67_09555 [Gammaproteobacteria bacterium]|nr:hypothetical protein [Gammaproteobacteria bacterium]
MLTAKKHHQRSYIALDLSRFTGRHCKLVGSTGNCIPPQDRVINLDIRRCGEKEVYLTLSCMIGSTKRSDTAVISGCNSKASSDLSNWCQRRGLGYYYCDKNNAFGVLLSQQLA